jgi:hypothetical protein
MDTYSREYLRSIPFENKIKEVNRIVNSFMPALRKAASNGDKFYFFDMTYMRYVSPQPSGQPKSNPAPTPPPYNSAEMEYSVSIEEMIPMFTAKFPGCDVNYQETWVQGDPGIRILKKGIIIDWT